MIAAAFIIGGFMLVARADADGWQPLGFCIIFITCVIKLVAYFL